MSRLVAPGHIRATSRYVHVPALPSYVVSHRVEHPPLTHGGIVAIDGVNELAIVLRSDQIVVATNSRGWLAKEGLTSSHRTGHANRSAVVPQASRRSKAADVALGEASASATLVVATIDSGVGSSAGATSSAEVGVGLRVNAVAPAVELTGVADVDAGTCRASLAFAAAVVAATAKIGAHVGIHTAVLAAGEIGVVAAKLTTTTASGITALHLTAVAALAVLADGLPAGHEAE